MIKILYSPHWPELIKLISKYYREADVIILEEPINPFFKQMIDGEITIEEYINRLRTDTYNLSPNFPKYTRNLCDIIRRLYKEGKEIYLIEPYYEAMERIYSIISEREELGKTPKEIIDEILSKDVLKEVYECEKKHYKALMDYYFSIEKGFDEAVEYMIRFTVADANKLILRDKLRAEAIAKLVSKYKDSEVLVEAGDMHIPLYIYLKRLAKKHEVTYIHILYKVMRDIGLRVFIRYGVLITLYYIFRGKIDDYMRLLAARNVIRLMLMSKEEKEPKKGMDYPKLIEEAGLHEYIENLTYEECRRLYNRIKSPQVNFSSFRLK